MTQKVHFILFVLITFPVIVFSQNKVDSLTKLIDKSSKDTKADLLVKRSVLYSPSHIERSLSDIQWAEDHYKEKEDRKGLANVYTNYSYLFGRVGKLEKALHYDSLATHYAADLEDKNLKAKVISRNGATLFQLGQIEKSSDLLQKAFSISDEVETKAFTMNIMGLLYVRKGNFQESEKSYDTGIRLLEGLGYDALLTQLLMNKANVLARVSRFAESADLHLKSLRIKEKMRDTAGLIQSYSNIGVVFQKMREFEKAVDYFTKSEQMATSIKSQNSLTLAVMNKAIAYVNLNKRDSARVLFFQAVDHALKTDNYTTMAQAFQNVGNFMHSENDLVSAEEFTLKAIEYAKKANNKQIELSLQSNLAKILIDKGREEEVMPVLVSIADSLALVDSLSTSTDNNSLKGFYGNMVNLYKSKKDYEKAFEYLNKLRTVEQNIFSQDSRLSAIKSENKYELEKKELEHALQQQKEKRKQFQIILVAITLIFLLLSLYIFLLARRKRMKTQYHAELKQLEQQHRIETARTLRDAEEEERKKIANKLHDEVGALLSIAKLNVSQLDKDLFVADSDASDKIHTAGKLLSEVAETVRNISHTLMPVALEKYGLKSAIHDLTNSVQSSGKIVIEEVIEGLDNTDGWRQDFVLGIYRIVQEALNNVIKHAEASHVLVQLVELEDAVTIYIEDNGRGISVEKDKDGLGMRLLQSNVEYFNGTIEINGRGTQGTFVLVELKKVSG